MSPRNACRIIFVLCALYLFAYGAIFSNAEGLGTIVALAGLSLSFFALLVDLFSGILGK